MRPRAQFSDPELEAQDVLTDLLADEDCDVGILLPADWANPSTTVLSETPFVQVAWDGTDNRQQIVGFATIRVTAWAADASEAKRLALLAEGLLMERPEARSLTGVLPARDPDNHAEAASFTVRWSMRSTPIP